ncbi:PTS sugar transporter subunit IIB [Oceanivirga salmonicida]|uniref:PTS sugar transporter subunit IIB n=1 Tax=Oceanivirga salmonicida TaxID=1769291 RepID=UPI000A60BFCD|nr:PTS sugar transporter subunit IIB [Oceanivirga salmonicida]
MKIMLCCSGGMSTSILVNKMREEAKSRGINVEIWAIAVNRFEDEFSKADVILLGPQIKYQLKSFKELAESKGKKIDVIEMIDYGMVRGDKVLEKALELMK